MLQSKVSDTPKALHCMDGMRFGNITKGEFQNQNEQADQRRRSAPVHLDLIDFGRTI